MRTTNHGNGLLTGCIIIHIIHIITGYRLLSRESVPRQHAIPEPIHICRLREGTCMQGWSIRPSVPVPMHDSE